MTDLPSDSTSFDWRLLDRYLAGESSPEEQAILDRWSLGYPKRRRLIQELEHVAAVSDAKSATVNTVADWEVLLKRIGHDALAQNVVHSAVEPKPVVDRWYRRATRRFALTTVAAFTVSVLSLWWYQSDWVRGRDVHTSDDQMLTYSTTRGGRATITLPDGSLVMLNVASTLQLPANYIKGSRTVYLRGEAFFTIAHRDADPFTVVAGPSTTRVLGTRFLVRHYPGDSTALIAVRDGKVAVGTHIVIGAQQIVVAGDGQGKIQAAGEELYAFSSGMLAIRDRALADVIPDLNRWYDADIRLGDSSLVPLVIDADLRYGELTDLIEILALAYDVRTVRRGRTLTLYRNSLE